MQFHLSNDSSRANKKLIAYINGYTGISQWAKYQTQLSQPMELVGGQAYYIEGLQAQADGPWHIGLGIKVHNLTWTSDYAIASHEEQTVKMYSSSLKETQVMQ